MKIAQQIQSEFREPVTGESRNVPDIARHRYVRTDIRPRLRTELCARASEIRNIEEGLSWIDHSEFHLSTALRELERVVDYLFAPRKSPGWPATARRVVTEAFEIVLEAANARLGNRPLFGGFAEADPISLEGGVWSYAGDSGRIKKRILPTGTIAVNVPGETLFGFTAGDSVFHVLDGIARDLELGQDVAVLAGDLQPAMRRLQDGMAELAAVRSRLSSAFVQTMVEQNRLRRYLNEVDGSAEVAGSGDERMKMATYQVAVDVFSRAVQPSLVDFLR